MNDELRWKDKYLSSLEQQEEQERRWQARYDLLRRGLVRSSLAAEGVDKAVDQCMQELRDLLRREDNERALDELIPRLEKAVLASEQRREDRRSQNAEALTGLTQQLLELQPPSELRKPLKQIIKRSNDGPSASELAGLLGELSHLQQQVLAQLSQTGEARPGLLQRLFGGKEQAIEEPAASTPSAAPLAQQAAPSEVAVSPAQTEQRPHEAQAPAASPAAAEVSAAEPATLPANPEHEHYALPVASEPGFSLVAEHINATLTRLLADLQPPDSQQAALDALRGKLANGLNWYELVSFLDELAVLVLALSGSGQREFATYLKQINERLAGFLSSLSETQAYYQEASQNAKALDADLRQQVGELGSNVQSATDLDELKRTVQQRLDGLLATVSHFQERRDSREEAMAQRLNTLLGRVGEMEQEAQGFRQSLEEQRQKALHDALTGLPNRAAWDERLALELARWQRYGGELLLAVLDIDHFKRINDGYGHLAGDKVLKIIAGELAKRLRKTDFIARFGGEEFVLLLPGTPLAGGQQLLETLRSAIAECPFHFKGERVTITLSGGLCSFASGESAEQIFERADQALYKAKQSGRNQIILAQ